jgi:hypothetical protein
VPVQWRNYNLKLGRYQGTLLDKDEKTAQRRSPRRSSRRTPGRTTAEEDRSGIEAIVERLLTAFD